MHGIILQRHDRAPQAPAGCDLVTGFELIQHGLPFFLAALLGQDQQKVKYGKMKIRGAMPSHDPIPPPPAELRLPVKIAYM